MTAQQKKAGQSYRKERKIEKEILHGTNPLTAQQWQLSYSQVCGIQNKAI